MVVLYFLNWIIADKIIIKPMIIIKEPKTHPHPISNLGNMFFELLTKKPKVNATKGGGILVFMLAINKTIYASSKKR